MIGWLILLFAWTDAFALSLGKINIQNHFGELFDAEIELSKEGEHPVHISIGTEKDYEKLGIYREDIVDALSIHYPLKEAGKENRVKLVSEKALFFPSFNLLIKAEEENGTVYENYLVTVDFQTNLSLRIQGSKNVEKTEDAKFSPGIIDAFSAKKPKETQPPGDEINALTLAGKATGGEKMDSVPEPNRSKGFSTSFPATLHVDSKTFPTPGASGKGHSQISTVPLPPLADQPMEPVVYGDTLFEVARSFKIPLTEQPRFAVALWMENQNKFIGGNIHGLEVGSLLNLNRLRERLEEIDPLQAGSILRSQWNEWMILKYVKASPVIVPLEETIREVPLPSENILDKAEIFSKIPGWKKSWETENFSDHMSYFSQEYKIKIGDNLEPVIKFWDSFKRRMFSLYDQVRIGTRSPTLSQVGNKVVVSFYQQFESADFNSFGWKNIDFVREGSDWKIVNEELNQKGANARSAGAPWVVHTSSYLDLPSATWEVNQLRQKGFNAYSSPVFVTPEKKIYRVFVERFSDRNLAERVARSLKRMNFGPYVLPMKFPCSVEVGVYQTEEEAAEKTRLLREKGLSAYIFSTSNDDFEHPVFKVLLGAYSTGEEAKELMSQLSLEGIHSKAVFP